MATMTQNPASTSHANNRAAYAEHGAYMDEIKAFPVLSETEERKLVRRWYKKGDRQAYDALISSHLRLVPKMAQKYSGYGVPLADLIGEGNIGLLQSAERFDPDKGFRFSTYARWWIRAAMLNFVLQ
ncbi:MAG: sigma-70 family RNA polymerase sigma factor, partial [Rhodospirillaceae bacterium]